MNRIDHPNHAHTLGGVCKSSERESTTDQKVSKFFLERIERLKREARRGNYDSQFYLGEYYEKGIGVHQSDRKAVYWYRKSAKQGRCYAQGKLGAFYLNGRGVRLSSRKGVKWLKKAAEKRDKYALYHLGYCYEHGIGVKMDPMKARVFYAHGVQQGSPEALCVIFKRYIGGQESLKYLLENYMGYESEAEEGVLSSFYYCDLLEGRLDNLSKYLKWVFRSIELAASWEYLDAQNLVGYCYAKGIGVDQNFSLAVAAWEKAAALGHQDALHQLSLCESA